MKVYKFSLLITIILVINACSNSSVNNKYSEEYTIVNQIINHHKSLKGIGEKFNLKDSLNSNTIIRYSDFLVYPRTSNITRISKENNELKFIAKIIVLPTAKFTDYFNIKDTTFIRNQQEKNKYHNHDTSQIKAQKISLLEPFNKTINTLQLDSISKKINKDILFVDKPLFSLDHKTCIIGCSYYKNLTLISKLYQLKKGNQNEGWQLIRTQGIVVKFTIKENAPYLSVLGEINRNIGELKRAITPK